MEYKKEQPELLSEGNFEKQESFSQYLRKKSKQLQDIVGEGDRKLYPQNEVANLLGVSVQQLRQKIYQKKPLTRDWVIAICAAYGLNEDATNEALILCNMPTFDANVRREEALVELLEAHENQPIGVDEINAILRSKFLQPLEIPKRKKGSKADNSSEIKSCEFTEIGKRNIRTFGNRFNPYNSLASEYTPDIRCIASVLLEDRGHNRVILNVSTNDDAWIEKPNSPNLEHISEDQAITQFQTIYSELKYLADSEKRKFDAYINDTKNYKGRYGAEIRNHTLHVFYEEFNFNDPWENEYYLMEYEDGQYTLSISKSSLFMTRYLAPEEYVKLYSNSIPAPFRIYHSVQEIDNLLQTADISQKDRGVLKRRKHTFEHLQATIDEKKKLVISGKDHIRDCDAIWDPPYEILKYYKAESLFEFKIIEEAEFYEKVDYKDAADVCIADDIIVPISFSDLQQGFELGLDTLEQIAELKHTVGELKNVLK